MKISKKIAIFSILALLVAICGTSIASFVFADKSAEDDLTELVAKADGDTPATKTIIDYIIEFSNDSSKVDEKYKIVELSSSSTPSDLETMVEGSEKVFGNQVFDGHKTITALFNQTWIEYSCYSVDDMKGDDTKIRAAASAIRGADFLYVSNDPNKMYSRDNDIPEEVRQALVTQIVDASIPAMVDSFNLTISLITHGAYTDYVTNTLHVQGTTYNTFSWPINNAGNEIAMNDFMDPGNFTAYYGPIDGNSQIVNNIWDSYTVDNGTDDEGKTKTKSVHVAKVLTITKAGGATPMTDMMKVGIDTSTLYAIDEVTFDADDNPTTEHKELPHTYAFTDAADLYTPDDNSRQGGYKYREKHPDAISFETVEVSETDNYLDGIDLTKYDFIVMEGNIKDMLVQADVEATLTSTMQAGVHILYSGKMVNTAGNASTKNTATSYKLLLDKTMDSSDSPKQANILVTSRNLVKGFSIATTPAAVDPVAAIINNGMFRGIGGSDASSLKYTVLEIEPYYPIDTVLAKQLGDKEAYNWEFVSTRGGFSTLSPLKASGRTNMINKLDKGFYYLRTDGVLDKTADEISFDGTTSLASMHAANDYSSITDANAKAATSSGKGLYDYYSWDVTQAKIAHATGKDYDEVRVVHMSSAELNSSRASLMDNYDAIYIGGDDSSAETAKFWHSNTTGVPVYTMYSGHGDTYTDPGMYSFSSDEIGVTLGNDITDEKLTELKDYVKAGMPVIISNTLKDAYDSVSSASQTKLDPDSRVVSFLDSIATSGKSNVLFGFDEKSNEMIDNTDKKYGSLAKYGKVTVFKDAAQLKGTLSVKERPKLVVMTDFDAFVEHKSETWIDGNTLRYTYEGNSGDVTAALFIDDDANSKFTADEVRDAHQGKTGTLSVTLPDDYYGVVYWRVVLYSGSYTANGISKDGIPKVPSACVTNICKIARGNKEKMKANVLQIMPQVNSDKWSEKNDLALFLDPECSQSKTILKGNRYVSGQVKYSDHVWRNNSGSFTDADYTNKGDANVKSILDSSVAADGLNYSTLKSKLNADGAADGYSYSGNNLGQHEFKFGIAVYQEGTITGSIANNDNWYTNWFDELRDDYEVTLNIVTVPEFQAMVAKVNNAYASIKNDASAVKTAKEGYYKEYEKYDVLYRAMKDVINGNADNITASDYTALKEYLWNKFEINETQLEKYKTCVRDMDKYIKDNTPTSFGGADTAWVAKEKAHETDSAIAGIDRTYYDMFSMAAASGYNDNIAYFENFAKQYIVWRNAMTIMQYFRYRMQNNLNLSCYDNGFQLSEAYSCIALGAASYFNGQDINDAGCEALARYCDDDANMLIFADTITAYDRNSSTTNIVDRKNMTKWLRTRFGLDARHMEKRSTGTSEIDNRLTIDVGGSTDKVILPAMTDGASVKITQGASTVEDINVRVQTFFDTQSGEFADTWDPATNSYVGDKSKGLHIRSEHEITVPHGLASATLYYTVKSGNSGDDRHEVIACELRDKVMAADPDAPHDIALKLDLGGYEGGNSRSKSFTSDMKFNGYYVSYKAASASNYSKQIKVYNINNWPDFKNIYNDGTGKYNSDIGDIDTITMPAGSVGKPKLEVTEGSNEDADGNKITTVGERTVTFTYYANDGKTLLPNAKFNLKNNTTGESLELQTDVNGVATYTYKDYKEITSETYALKAGASRKRYRFSTDISSTKKINPEGLTPYAAQFNRAYLDDFGNAGEPGSKGAMALVNKYALIGGASVELRNQVNHMSIDLADVEFSSGANHVTTDKAQQNNEGIVVLYPFTLGKTLQLSATAGQSFAADVEDPDMTVYYSLAGGSGGSISSMYTADPRDGANNYFVYQYKSVTYSGAGHATITGSQRANNDERRLYINVIVNTARKSTLGVDLKLYDKGATFGDDGVQTNKIIKDDPKGLDDYVRYVQNMSEIVDFAFYANTDKSQEIKKLEAYFDLDYTGNDKNTYDSAVDKLVYVKNIDSTNRGTGAETNEAFGDVLNTDEDYIQDTGLKLSPDYFLDEKYAYLVVVATDSKNKTSIKRVRIEIKPEMYHLN